MNYKFKRQYIVKLNEGSEIGLIKELILFETKIQTKVLLSMRVYNKIEVICFGVKGYFRKHSYKLIILKFN